MINPRFRLMFMMVSRVARQNNGQVMRIWDITQIRSLDDAKKVSVGDIIVHDRMHYKITWIGEDERSYPKQVVWCGRVSGENSYGLKDNDVVAWGPKGMANSFPDYKDGKYIGKPTQLAEKTP